jgi:hypothetical protein
MAWTGIVLNYDHPQPLPLFGPLLLFITSNIGCGLFPHPPISKHNTYHIQHRVFNYFPIPTDQHEMLRCYKLRDHINANY